jgi:hypothetical protein
LLGADDQLQMITPNPKQEDTNIISITLVTISSWQQPKLPTFSQLYIEYLHATILSTSKVCMASDLKMDRSILSSLPTQNCRPINRENMRLVTDESNKFKK